MKSVIIFVVLVVVLGQVACIRKKDGKVICRKYDPLTSSCKVDPCLNPSCDATTRCCISSKLPCDYYCTAKCQGYGYAPQVPVNCVQDPCNSHDCGADQVCCADYSSGCDYRCFPA